MGKCFDEWMGGTLGMNPNNSLPEYYWNVKSHEERIYLICCEIQKIYAELQEDDNQIEALTKRMTELEKAFELLKAELGDQLTEFEAEYGFKLSELQKQFDEFKKSGFDDYYKKQVEIWINQNMQKIWASFVARVFFGLEDGYFVAYVPEQWSDLEFSTGTEYGTPEYGRLILSYD